MAGAWKRGAHAPMRTVLTGVLASAALVAGLLTGGSAAAGAISESTEAPIALSADGLAVDTGIVQAADLSKFQPGNIISDAVFFNKGTMTEAQIQSFLQAKVPTCSAGYTCLKDYYDTARTISADAMCGAYSGGSRERASRIIYKVAQACGINPQVLLVMLQKEQGLVRSTAPSSWNYQAAMGQGCPDTAACDTRYYGLFNQLFWGAWQLKRYANPPGTSQYFTWYAPGKTWNVRWHPNAACGSSPVFIQNQATSDLYYYTPYQPNAAALRAGYGTGDGCSSYGNRNFYQYFTDWFGSTQTISQALVKYGSSIWLTTEDRRYHVTSEAYPEYKGVYGAPIVVDATYINLFRDSGFAGFYIRNTSTGEVAMLLGGKTHRFSSCALVATWGGSCGSALVQLAPREFTKPGSGPEMTTFAYPAAGARLHHIVGTELVPVFDLGVAQRINNGVAPYAGVMPPRVAAMYTTGTRVEFAPGDFVLQQGAPEVYLPTSDGRLIHLRSWTQASELGLAASLAARAPAADLAAYTRTGEISTFVTCGTVNYFAAGGKLSKLEAGVPAGFTPTALDSATCQRLKLTGPTISGKVFVKVAGQSAVYDLAGGYARHVANQPQLLALNGGTWPTILTISQSALALYPLGGTYPADGTLIRGDGRGEVWFVDGARILHLPSWGMARAYGLPSTVNVIPAAEVDQYTNGGSLTHFVSCSGTLYAAGGDMLSKVVSGDPAGNPVTQLSPSACAALKLGGAPIPGAMFVSDGVNAAVATAGGFLRLPDQASILRANGGTLPASKWITAAYFGSLPQPTQMPGSGDLVRASNSSAVTFIDGARRLHLPNWGVAADLGVQPRYRILPPATLATLPVSSTSVSPFVTCGPTSYVAAQGSLSPITATGLSGASVTKLESATCATLALTGAPIPGKLFVRAVGAEQVYVMENGRFRALAAGESPAGLNGGVQPPILTMDARTITGLQR